MTLLNVHFPCVACSTRPDSQPNYCRKCGGRGYIPRTITEHQLTHLSEIPEVIGATIRVKPKKQPRHHRKGVHV